MGQNDLRVVLEVEKESANHENEMFYRYRIGDFKLWFTQADNGNIYSVGFVEDGDELKDFELHVYADEYGRGGYYPNVFEIRLRSYAMTTSEVRDYMVKAEKACAVLDVVEDFFKNSKHYELYCKGHGIEIEKGTRDDLSRVGDEMISRKVLLHEIMNCYNRIGLRPNADCQEALNIIRSFSAEDEDLILRGELLNELLDYYGCDLAYLGTELQLIQDVIVGVPAASEAKVDALISDAAQRSELRSEEKLVPELGETKLM